jgi:hypothetical protein
MRFGHRRITCAGLSNSIPSRPLLPVGWFVKECIAFSRLPPWFPGSLFRVPQQFRIYRQSKSPIILPVYFWSWDSWSGSGHHDRVRQSSRGRPAIELLSANLKKRDNPTPRRVSTTMIGNGTEALPRRQFVVSLFRTFHSQGKCLLIERWAGDNLRTCNKSKIIQKTTVCIHMWPPATALQKAFPLQERS